MELSREKHHTLATDQKRMLIPRHNILQRFAALVRLDEMLRLAGQSTSRDILHSRARQKSCLKQVA
jgi:hypothetical protein